VPALQESSREAALPGFSGKRLTPQNIAPGEKPSLAFEKISGKMHAVIKRQSLPSIRSCRD
jgi:hypothetical protein